MMLRPEHHGINTLPRDVTLHIQPKRLRFLFTNTTAARIRALLERTERERAAHRRESQS